VRAGGEVEFLTVLDSEGPISRDEFVGWGREAKTLPILGRLYRVLLEATKESSRP
jgi:hypothetical protein